MSASFADTLAGHTIDLDLTKSVKKKADLTYVINAAEVVGKRMKKGSLVILESTVPPNTTVGIFCEVLEKKSGLKSGVDFFLAHCPERVLPAQILKELVENDRIIGAENEMAAQKANAIYSTFVQGKIYFTIGRKRETQRQVYYHITPAMNPGYTS